MFVSPLLLALLLLLVRAPAWAAPTELYFEFDERAVSGATEPGARFCQAVVPVFDPAVDAETYCLDPAAYAYRERVAHGRLTNARIVVPSIASNVSVDSPTTRASVSGALLDTEFFYQPSSVTLVVFWTESVLLNSLFTSFAFVVLAAVPALTMCLN